ncbi:fumarase, class II [Pilibacter termitis]|uniref:Fumarate hydratase class II n=1 Tax=Pilibacter termitis TaxID=263852 RepID=A0A1T4L1M9_9ENTE|nr:class II fumarate hydratase [Pilibacter termitis]SJZ48596.1 fumarase, class II [Pilibacter termitis]
MSIVRICKDSMGEVKVAGDKFWGAQTQRSLENFKIGEETMPIPLIEALVRVKAAAAKANAKTGKLSKEREEKILYATDMILKEKMYDQFPLVVWQTGSGTQTNMNVNEVISYIANTKEGGEIVHPNDHVNMSQSSNDVFPTAMHVAFINECYSKLFPSLKKMASVLEKLEKEYNGLVKIGRTHLQDATPITFGQEISGWKNGIHQAGAMVVTALREMEKIAIGGTAVGTGINATSEYIKEFIDEISEDVDYYFREDSNKFHALTSLDAEVFLSGALKALASNLMKMANDIRLLASGPRCGFGEITIPSNEPGSSIMPGKVNPTQCEAITMLALQVIGNDATISMSATQGNFELNVFMPVVAYNLLQSIKLLTDGMENFTEKCLIGLTANEEKMTENLNNSLMLVTALNTHIGYENGAKIAKKAFEENKTLKEAAIELGLVTSEEYDKWVVPEEMI